MLTAEYLDAIKARHGIASDYKLAQFMGWSHVRISQWRAGRSGFNTDACLEVADALGISPAKVLADMAAMKDKNNPERWREVAAALCVTAALFLGSVFYSPATVAAQFSYLNIHYAQFRRRLAVL